MPHVLTVDRGNITDIALAESPSLPLEEGQARLVLQSFALTANNVTYAASGAAIGYWKFFPTEAKGRGIVPVWGTAVVSESRAKGIEPGQRFYGFYPMGAELVVTPKVGRSGFTDAAPHREGLPPIYNRYYPVGTPPSDDDALRAIFQPLLATSFLIADWLDDNAWFGAEQVIVGSASSKTGLGVGYFLQDIEGRAVRSVGLTSAGNRDFVSATGAFDEVVTYNAVETLPVVPSVYVDMAGDSALKARLHGHLGSALKHSAAVGMSHWDAFDPATELPGPKPQFFFAPAQAEKRRADWGADEADRRVAQAWRRVAKAAGGWMELRRHAGLEAAAEVYRALASGNASPRDGHVVALL